MSIGLSLSAPTTPTASTGLVQRSDLNQFCGQLQTLGFYVATEMDSLAATETGPAVSPPSTILYFLSLMIRYMKAKQYLGLFKSALSQANDACSGLDHILSQ
jgi:hypothetical protein